MTTKSMTLEAPKRYHPALVPFHWIIVLLIFTNLFLAFAPEGPGGLIPKTLFGLPIVGIHMLIGTVILVLLTFRLITRIVTQDPEPATVGNALLDKVGVLTHYALYLFTFVMTISGLVMSLQRGYFREVVRHRQRSADVPAWRYSLGGHPRTELDLPGGPHPAAHWRSAVSPVHPQGPFAGTYVVWELIQALLSPSPPQLPFSQFGGRVVFLPTTLINNRMPDGGITGGFAGFFLVVVEVHGSKVFAPDWIFQLHFHIA